MTEIVICPKAISKINSSYEGAFFFYFLRQTKRKAIIPNKCWSALKYRIREKYIERYDDENVAIEKSDEHIAKLRCWLQPEIEIKDKYGRDIIPFKDYENSKLIEETKDLVARKWAIIRHFISDNGELFEGAQIDTETIDSFFQSALEKDEGHQYRIIAEKFVAAYPQGSW